MDREQYEEYLAGEHWARVIETTTRLAGGKCVRCSAHGDDCHHQHYRTLGREIPGVDAILVCRQCHEFLHGRSSFDPASKAPADELPRTPPSCIDCGWDAEAMTDDDQPICRDCLRQRCMPD